MNYKIIPDLPFKFIIGSVNNTFTVTNTWIDTSGWVMYDVVRDYDGICQTASVTTLMTNLKSGDWKIIKEESKFTKADLKDGMICTTRRGEKCIVKGNRMTSKDRGYMMLEDINDDLTVTGLDFLDIIYVHQQVFERIDQKQLAIQKELGFAKAKAERLAAHISVLESKLK